MLTVQREDQGKVVSFHIDNTTAVSYLQNKGSTQCSKLNGLARKILLSCHKDRLMVCQEYLHGVASLRENSLSRGKEDQKWSLGTPACQRLFRWWGTPVVGLLVTKMAFKVSQYFHADLSSKKTSGGDAPKEEWLEGLRYDLLFPNIIQLVLRRLVK